jgi:geranylgeranyl diphosphate synthase type II
MKTRIDAALSTVLRRAEETAPPRLSGAIRHAVFPGGARVRPQLCLSVAGAQGHEPSALALAAACSIELLHCASLVHDDLPCFDDADRRRGRPSVHRAFGEPLAILAGDALIVLAFETLARECGARPEQVVAIVATVARAVGTPSGLVAGQAWESEPSVPLDKYHRAKTGALFVAATMSGAIAAGRDPAPWREMGERLGDAYQIADDLLDALAMSDEGGKPVQRDASLGRPNAVAKLGVSGALGLLRNLVAQAVASVPDCAGAEALRGLVLKMADRLVPAGLKQSAA